MKNWIKSHGVVSIIIAGALLLGVAGLFTVPYFLHRAAMQNEGSQIAMPTIMDSSGLFEPGVQKPQDQDTMAAATQMPGPFSVSELQAKLSAFEESTAYVEIGGFSLSTHDMGLLDSAMAYANEQDYHVGFLLLDINTGWGIAYNADEEFYSASSIKGIYVASLTAKRPESLLNMAEVMYLVVHDSNNDLYFELRQSYGVEPLMQWCDEAGLDQPIGLEWFPYYTPRTLSKLWLKNYEYFESAGENMNEIASWYTSTNNSPISKKLGLFYKVYSKAGWIVDGEYSATVDAGIIYAEDHPYIMVVMSDAPSDFAAIEPVIDALSEIHYYLYWKP